MSAILAKHTLAAFDLMDRDQTLDGARRVWRWVERKRAKSFTQRDCWKGLRKSFKRTADIQPVFDILKERHYLFESEKDTSSSNGGRPSRVFVVNPVLSKDW